MDNKVFKEIGYIVILAIWAGLLLISTVDPHAVKILTDFLQTVIQNSQHNNAIVPSSSFGL